MQIKAASGGKLCPKPKGGGQTGSGKGETEGNAPAGAAATGTVPGTAALREGAGHPRRQHLCDAQRRAHGPGQYFPCHEGFVRSGACTRIYTSLSGEEQQRQIDRLGLVVQKE